MLLDYFVVYLPVMLFQCWVIVYGVCVWFVCRVDLLCLDTCVLWKVVDGSWLLGLVWFGFVIDSVMESLTLCCVICLCFSLDNLFALLFCWFGCFVCLSSVCLLVVICLFAFGLNDWCCCSVVTWFLNWVLWCCLLAW